MIYLLYGLDEYLIKEEIIKILNNHNIEKINISKYDLEVDLIEHVVEDAGMISLFSDKKAIIVTNSYIFTGKNGQLEHNLDLFMRYLEDINPDTIIIFSLLSDKLDERKKVVKRIKEVAKITIFSKDYDIYSIVKKMFLDYQISDSDINYLIKRVGNNLEQINNEVNKLISYKILEKVITKDDITDLVTENIEADTFSLIEHLVNRNKDQALSIYSELLKVNEEPIKTLVMIANQFRLMYQVKEMSMEGLSEGEIASSLAIHPYRVKLAKEKSRNYDSKLLLKYLNDLSDLDNDIKTGQIDKYLGLELFIINA